MVCVRTHNLSIDRLNGEIERCYTICNTVFISDESIVLISDSVQRTSTLRHFCRNPSSLGFKDDM